MLDTLQPVRKSSPRVSQQGKDGASISKWVCCALNMESPNKSCFVTVANDQFK